MPNLDLKQMNTSGFCCDGMQMAINSHVFHMQLVGELILLPLVFQGQDGHMILNYCPWCKTIVNPDVEIHNE